MNFWSGLRCKVNNRKLVTIGIPVLNEESNIPTLIERMQPVISQIHSLGVDVEIIVNNNASLDKSADLLNEWANSDSKVKVNHFLVTVPFQESILRLIQQSKGQAFILLQSDLQDPPELLVEFITNWNLGHDLVAGIITKRNERIFQRAVRKVFYWSLKSFSDGTVIVGLQDFYLIDKKIIDQLKELSPVGLFLRGHISTRFGYVKKIPYVRAKRQKGSSNFDFPTKYSLALDGLLLFGTRFIRTISTISFGLFCFGVLGTIGLLISYFLGFRPTVQGWASLGVILLTLLALFGMTTGIILEFLIRIYRFQILSKS